MSEVLVPKEIQCSEQVFDIAFHPLADFLAAGLVNGHIDVYKLSIESDNQLVLCNNKHKSSIRGLIFSNDGNSLYSISSDKSIQAIDSIGKKKFHIKNAHNESINKIISLDDNLFSTGDDNGTVKIWDSRIPTNEVIGWSLHEDFVSGMVYSPDTNILISVSGDATLCIYDTRNPKNNFRSDDQEAELSCVDIFKNNKKVVCGTQEGAMVVFSWDRWEDCNDRFTGHPESIDCILKIDENAMLTGSSDGIIRVVSLHPNKILGVIGDQEEFPVEGIKINRDGRLLSSYSHDDIIRFWDVSMFADDVDDDEEVEDNIENIEETIDQTEVEEMEEDIDNDNEMDDDDSDSIDSDDDSSIEQTKYKTKSKYKSKNEEFFKDL